MIIWVCVVFEFAWPVATLVDALILSVCPKKVGADTGNNNRDFSYPVWKPNSYRLFVYRPISRP